MSTEFGLNFLWSLKFVFNVFVRHGDCYQVNHYDFCDHQNFVDHKLKDFFNLIYEKRKYEEFTDIMQNFYETNKRA